MKSPLNSFWKLNRHFARKFFYLFLMILFLVEERTKRKKCSLSHLQNTSSSLTCWLWQAKLLKLWQSLTDHWKVRSSSPEDVLFLHCSCNFGVVNFLWRKRNVALFEDGNEARSKWAWEGRDIQAVVNSPVVLSSKWISYNHRSPRRPKGDNAFSSVIIHLGIIL